jgi:hypothetical protein
VRHSECKILLRCAWGLLPSVLGLALCSPAFPQKSSEYGGFVRETAQIFARKPNSSDTYVNGTGQFQFWYRATIQERFSFRGAVDFQLDTHGDVDRDRWFDLSQRGLRRPAGALSELYLDAKLGHVDLRVGKQQIRWGRADGLNPTDNLIPYDYLDTFSDVRLAVPALKTDVYLGQANFGFVWIPFYTPTRLPLIGQRWFPYLPSQVLVPVNQNLVPVNLRYQDTQGPMPAGTLGNGQWGIRYNQILSKSEFSLSYFDGFDDIPYYRPNVTPLVSTSRDLSALVSLRREYFRVRVAGIDFASSIGPLGVRGEAAYFDQTDPNNLDHMIFVIGVDKSWGDWSALIQYTGQKLSRQIDGVTVFPDLGLRSTMICRVERTLGPSRSIEIRGALGLRDRGFLLQPTYSLALSNRWRLKVGANVFAGEQNSYLGQFRDSSHANIQLTYAF